MMVHFNEKCQTERSNWSCCHVLVLWVLDVRSTVGAPDWARVQFKIRVLKRWKRFYIKHTEGNIHTDVLHYELCSDFSVSLWISFQFHRQHFSSVMFWSCVISVEMSVCAEEMLRNELCWFKGMNWIIWWIIRFNTFHVFIISFNMWAVSQNRLSVSDLNWSMENKLHSRATSSKLCSASPSGVYLSIVCCILIRLNCFFTLIAVTCC